MRLYNSLSKEIEEFVPLNPPKVGMYACGMTVYDYAHIGHGRKYVGDDILRRTLVVFGYNVTHIQNVTDVGHLVSDADEGEDKLEKGAKKHGKTVWEVAKYFENHFFVTMDSLNVLRPSVICRATEHIAQQIELVLKLIEKKYAYVTPEAVYFDVEKFPEYGKAFAGQTLTEKKTAVRSEVQTGIHKKNPADFALWFKRVGRFENHVMYWESPWGEGFPGWHVECSAMSMKYLGEQFDIHTGGEDHLTVHHPNEIAQSEAATGKHPFVKYWVHHAFLKVDNKKMSKSLGNFVTIEDVIEKGHSPLALRYLFLTAHYRDPLNFTWDSLGAAQVALDKLKNATNSLKGDPVRQNLSSEKLTKIDGFRTEFRDSLANDLSTPKALAVVWKVFKSNIPNADKFDLIEEFDEVLGLNLTERTVINIPAEISELAQKRETLRKESKYNEADALRAQIEEKGYSVIDTANGIRISARSKAT